MTNCKRCKEEPASICITCYHDLVTYYDQQIENLTAQAQAAPELLAALEWVEWVEDEDDGDSYCPCCDSERGLGHHDDCQLAQALARARAD